MVRSSPLDPSAISWLIITALTASDQTPAIVLFFSKMMTKDT